MKELIKQKKLHDMLCDFRFNILENSIKDNYLYTRKVNIPIREITQLLYEIDNSISTSFKFRGGFAKDEQ